MSNDQIAQQQSRYVPRSSPPERSSVERCQISQAPDGTHRNGDAPLGSWTTTIRENRGWKSRYLFLDADGPHHIVAWRSWDGARVDDRVGDGLL